MTDRQQALWSKEVVSKCVLSWGLGASLLLWSTERFTQVAGLSQGPSDTRAGGTSVNAAHDGISSSGNRVTR